MTIISSSETKNPFDKGYKVHFDGQNHLYGSTSRYLQGVTEKELNQAGKTPSCGMENDRGVCLFWEATKLSDRSMADTF